MIAQICGKISKRGDNYLLVDVSGISYEVFIPTDIMRRITDSMAGYEQVKLVTYHYYNVEPSKSVPVLIGFLNEIERDFFQAFITVSGVGPKAALKALAQPISVIARAIDKADLEFLKSLPGIGQQRAKEIVAKLQGKVGKFALLQDSGNMSFEAADNNLEAEALEVLIKLQYRKQEATEMIRKAIERNPNWATTEDLLNEVYRQKTKL